MLPSPRGEDYISCRRASIVEVSADFQGIGTMAVKENLMRDFRYDNMIFKVSGAFGFRASGAYMSPGSAF